MLNVIENLKLTHKFALILMASTFAFNGNADEKQLAQLSEGLMLNKNTWLPVLLVIAPVRRGPHWSEQVCQQNGNLG